ncbi:MucR family transcriptional regulator [Saccharibacter sp. 17.LH.SD]|uniref:MucR family transcriptional regulator n=1 Tax=Saccharibacter sp. 17.LH.SD TaxID=2689393 RepID=UPI00136C0F6C|nr:MucR family transcriptional regulator [Saccharibacter sp. 17.LH.SD]MXV44638.1 MucR family transcriptional regulator [Saccharibacter sp. 17.LH.SD]
MDHTTIDDQANIREREHEELLKLTTEITIAKVAGSFVEIDALPGLIRSIYMALAGQSGSVSGRGDGEASARPQPAVPIKKSVYPDYIVCLEDGKKLKMLKRHLQSNYGLSPEQYREKWGLPDDYPLVAPNYAERRSVLARHIGLGRNIGSASDGRRSDEDGQDEKS